MSLESVMQELGFSPDPEHHSLVEALAVHFGMHNGGPFNVLSAWSNGPVKAHVEQNTCPDPLDPETSVIHPPVLVVEGPTGRQAVNPKHEDQLKAVLSAAKEGN